MTTSASNPRSARKGYLKPAQITGYLAGAVGTTAILAVPQAEAAVTAVSFGFGENLTTSWGTGNTSVGSFGYLQVESTSGRIALGDGGRNNGTVYQNQSYDVNNGTPTFFTYGDVLGNSPRGNNAAAFFKAEIASLNFTSDQTDKFIGFKTTTNNYGWANVTYTVGTNNLKINSAYVESIENAAITVGDVGAVPEPSRALLALAGFGAVALRRRRKQAA
jgi:MYXO-CTERM domain-containing protein